MLLAPDKVQIAVSRLWKWRFRLQERILGQAAMGYRNLGNAGSP